MSKKNKIVVLSDIHIGTNTQTVWYQQKYHEPYLLAVLEWIIENKNEIKELVLLGDIVDFWTYPSDEKPPSFDDIMKANPKILGENGKLSDVLVKLEGKVTYVRGNHDMNISQEDLNKIKNTPYPDYKITLHKGKDDIYYPLDPDKRIVCTHGHIFTMFNAPYGGSDNKPSPIAPLPLGHFITRAIASWNKTRLEDKPNETVADYEGSGEPSLGAKLESFIPSLDTIISSLLRDSLSYATYNQEFKKEVWNKLLSLSTLILDTMANLANLTEHPIIKLPSGENIQFSKVREIYTNLFSEWQEKDDFLTAYKALMADYNGSYMGWFAQKLAFQVGSELVVMGHTHTPISGLSNSLIQYANSGFYCPSLKEMEKPDIFHFWKQPKIPTFITITIEDTLQVNVKQVNISEKFKYEVLDSSQDQASEDKVVADPLLNRDFSCYVIIDNTAGPALKLEKKPETVHGYYVFEPPETIEHGKIVKFWLQDYLGGYGAEGSVTYITNQDTPKSMTLKYGCPFVEKNYCSGTQSFWTKSGDHPNWVENGIQESGHPFFVRFIITTE